MAISYRSNTTYGARSVNFPSSSHPTTDLIKKQISDIKTWASSSSCKPSIDTVCDGLSMLSRLYELVFDSLSWRQNHKQVEEIMDGLVVFMDVCGAMRDLVSQVKEHVRDLQCALRRRKGDKNVENAVSGYKSFTKKIKKDVKGLIASLKTYAMAANSENEEVGIEVCEVTVSVFRSVLMFFVMRGSRTPKTNKWFLVVSKLIRKTRVACEEHRNYEQHSTDVFEYLDGVLLDGCIEDESSKCRLETIEDRLERIEGGLECIFRRLIRTRASLLNIV